MIRREMNQGLSSGLTAERIPRITGPVATEREKLELMASNLGIEFSGRSDEELRSMISEKMSR